MELLTDIFNTILYRPLFNALVLFYQFLPGQDFGIAVIALTILIRLILSPLMIKSLKSQKILSEIQSKSQEIQRKYKNDKERQTKEIMELYQREKINPLGGCLPSLIQLPVLFALYRVFWRGLQPEALGMLYSFVSIPVAFEPSFLGILDLSSPSWVLAVLAGIGQYFQAKIISPKKRKLKKGAEMVDQISSQMSNQMIYFFPIFTFFILARLPAAVGLYWLTTVIFSIGQQRLIHPSSKITSLEPEKTT